MTERKTWTPTDVVDVSGPPALLRNYLEQGRCAIVSNAPN